MDFKSRLIRIGRGVPIVGANAGPDLDLEWLAGGFSKMVVGESHHATAFMDAYGPLVWAGAKRRTAKQVRDMITVELRREPDNPHDRNAISVWFAGNARLPGLWRAGYVHRELAARVAPVVDGNGIASWRNPAGLLGTVSSSEPVFGLFVIPSRLIGRGPDLSILSRRLELSFEPASARQVAFILSLLGAGPSANGLVTEYSRKEQAEMLARVGSPRHWKDPRTWRALDQHQASIAIDALQGRVQWIG